MKNLLIYTIITDLEDLLYPPLVEDFNSELIAVTQLKGIKSPFWKVRQIKDLPDIEEKLKASPEEYFPGYKAYQYVDKSAIIYGPLSQQPEAFMEVPSLTSLIPDHISLKEPMIQEFSPNPTYTEGPYDGYPLQLSICLPISNRADTLKKCLNGLQPLLEGLDAELIVVDTSTDGSREIAESYGAKIIPFAWTGDFAAARNAAIQEARGAWIFSIDDDEWLEDPTEFLHFFRASDWKKYDTGLYVVRNYTNPRGSEYNDISIQRLAKNHPRLRYIHAVHESFDFSFLKGNAKPKYFSAFTHHFGYAYADDMEREKKAYRNLASMYTALKAAPTELRLLYQLANEVAVLRDYASAAAYCLKLMSLARLEALDEPLRDEWEKSALLLLYLLSHQSGKSLYAEIAQSLVNIEELDCFRAGTIHYISAVLAFNRQDYDEVSAHGEAYEKCRKLYLKRPDQLALSSRFTVDLVGPALRANSTYMIYTFALLERDRETEAASIFAKVDRTLNTDTDIPMLARFFCLFNVKHFRKFCNEVDGQLLEKMYEHTKNRAVSKPEQVQDLFADLQEKLSGLVNPEEPLMRLITMYAQPDRKELYQQFAQDTQFLQAYLSDIFPCAASHGFDVRRFLSELNLEQLQQALRSLITLEAKDWNSLIKAMTERADADEIAARSKKELFFLSGLLEYALLQEEQLMWEKDSDKYREGFLLYIRLISHWSDYYYRKEMFAAESFLLLPATARGAFWVNKALEHRKAGQTSEFIEGLKQAVALCPPFDSGVKLLLKELKEGTGGQANPISDSGATSAPNQASNEFQQLGQQLKATARQLISAGSLTEATNILLQLQKLLPEDKEIEDLLKVCKKEK